MTSLRLKRGTTTQNNSYTGPPSELTVDITSEKIKLCSLGHNGSLTKFKKGIQGIISQINVNACINFLMEEY